MEALGTKEIVLCSYEVKFLQRSKKTLKMDSSSLKWKTLLLYQKTILLGVTATKTGSSDQTTEFGAKLCHEPGI